MASIYWLFAFVILIGIEAMTMALTTIWFAGGALAAFILSLLGAGIEVQLCAFVIVSFILLFFTRPFASKFVNKNIIKTNVEDLAGKHARVTAVIDNNLSTGAAVVNGQEWTARSAADSRIFQPDTMVEIVEVQGVKLIVKEIQEGV